MDGECESPIDGLAAQMDSTHQVWDLYRTVMGQWCVVIYDRGTPGDRATHRISGDSLMDVLSQAIEYRFLPVVPRCPDPFYPDRAVIEKSGNEWHAYYDGDKGYLLGTTKTKKRMLEALAERSAHTERIREEWMREYGWTLTKTEGVDFRYER